jgi:hypothetical protein
MRTLTYNPETQEWIESDDGLEPETRSTEWHLKILRRTRNHLLAETDWMANSDVTMTDAWKTLQTLHIPQNLVNYEST